MRKITEVLRLKAAGLGNREIAASIGAGKTTVYEILARAEATGLSWPLHGGDRRGAARGAPLPAADGRAHTAASGPRLAGCPRKTRS